MTKVIRLVGFDTGGETFVSGDRILRGIYRGQGSVYRDVVRRCREGGVFQHGIVATNELADNPHPELDYDVVFEHERIPFITYPHEWPASMFKDAAMFHLDLFGTLGSIGLTLKDWHLYNVLFRDNSPVFVDFASIVPAENLVKEGYLTPPVSPRGWRWCWDEQAAYYHEMYRRMFLPYCLLPIYMMRQGRHASARARMWETALNAAQQQITMNEVFQPGTEEERSFARWERKARFALIRRGPEKRHFMRVLREEIVSLDVRPKPSGYVDYYHAKQECFGFEPSPEWGSKQRVVHAAISEKRPSTVMDIGCNTGWFSMLAAKYGCHVVALDVDESCVDLLYERARAERLTILPLVLNFASPTPDLPALTFPSEPSRSLISGDYPLILSADKRLACDMVLVLALLHHLVLGLGMSFERVLDPLVRFARRELIIEFVGKEDPLIIADRGFFPAFTGSPTSYGWYTIEAFSESLARRFRTVEKHQMDQPSRTLFICSK